MKTEGSDAGGGVEPSVGTPAVSPIRRKIQTKTLWGGARTQTVLSYALAAGAVAAAVLVLGDEATHHIRNFEAWIAELGLWAPVVFVLLFIILSSVFVPDTLQGIAAGATFGFLRGLLLTSIGTAAGSALQYILSRKLFRTAIYRFVRSRPALAAIQTAVLQQEWKLQLLIRLTPLNRAVASYTLGVAGVGFPRFILACVALLPNLALEVYFGVAGRHVAKMVGPSGHAFLLHDVALLGGLVVAVSVMALVSRTARRALDAATAAAPRSGIVEK